MAPSLLHRTCIICPRGCSLQITVDDGRVTVEGNECPNGEDHGIEEATAPRRILTTTVQTTVTDMPRLPVRSVGDVLLMDIDRLIREIDSVVVARPLQCGDLVAADLCGIGVNLIATDDLAGVVPDTERGE